MRDIGKNIRLLRTKRNITQDELAEKLFVSRQTISNYETGRSKPDVDTLIRISEILDTEVQDLLYGPSVPQNQITERHRLLFRASPLAIMAVFYVGVEHLIEYLKNAPHYLYLSRLVPGVSYSLWLILRPCLFLLIGWTVMQILSLLPKSKILRYDTKCAHKIIVAFIFIYFLIAGVFCGWMLFTDWQSYQHSLSGSTEGFYASFSFPVIIQCIRFFANHRNSLWVIFIPLGVVLWLSAGSNSGKNESTEKAPIIEATEKEDES